MGLFKRLIEPRRCSLPVNSKPMRTIDLSSEPEFTFRLLDDTRAWRERSLHEFSLHDSDHVDVKTTYQIRIPTELVAEFQSDVLPGDKLRLVLPFTVRAKELLFDVSIQGAGGSHAALLLRQESASLQAEYLGRLTSDSKTEGDLEQLWFGVSAYTLASWHEHQARSPRSSRHARPSQRAHDITQYLNADLPFEVELDQVIQWLDALDRPKALLVEALREGEDPDSSSECILLAIPFMPGQPSDAKTITRLLDDFVQAVESMDNNARQALAEYGRRWEVFLETEVPVGQACSIQFTETRVWKGSPSPILEQEIPLGDAVSAHIEIRAADHGVVIDKPNITDLTGAIVGYEAGDAIRETADAIAIYASDPERPYFARVSVRVRARTWQRLLIWSLLLLVIGAQIIVWLIPNGVDLVNSLTLLTFPLTLAGTFVLTRAPTPLTERLLRKLRLLLMAAIVTLWMSTLYRLYQNDSHPKGPVTSVNSYECAQSRTPAKCRL